MDKNLGWFYAANPRLTRYSMGLREPREILIRFSLHARPLWGELHVSLRLERTRAADGGGIAVALGYGLKRWKALGRTCTMVTSVSTITTSSA